MFFNGDRRNTTIELSRVINMILYSDGIEIEKPTGRADVFLMPEAEARLCRALVTAIRRGTE